MSLASPADDAAARMDRMYRHQRFVYDLTRRWYLLGRDRLLDRLAAELPQGASLCEVGCGTARNLIRLARRRPDLRLCGLDASTAMLATARAALARRGLAGRIFLRQGLAAELDGGPFDAVLFSYALSMMPGWRRAVDRARTQLAPSGLVAAVDFADGRGLPRWFRHGLHRWLAMFAVRPNLQLVPFFQSLVAAEGGELRARPIFGRYALLLTYRTA